MIAWRQPDACTAGDRVKKLHLGLVLLVRSRMPPGWGSRRSWQPDPPARAPGRRTLRTEHKATSSGHTQPEPNVMKHTGNRRVDVVSGLRLARRTQHMVFKGTYVHWRSPARALLAVRRACCWTFSMTTAILRARRTSHACMCGALRQYPTVLVRRCACVDLFGSSRRAAAVGHHAARRLLPQLCVPHSSSTSAALDKRQSSLAACRRLGLTGHPSPRRRVWCLTIAVLCRW